MATVFAERFSRIKEWEFQAHGVEKGCTSGIKADIYFTW